MAHLELAPDLVPLASVDPNLISNIRTSMDPAEITGLAIDIIERGLLQYPAVRAFVQDDGNGGEVPVYGIVFGNRRFAALRRAQEMLTEHNERASRENGFEDVGEDYPFQHEVIDTDFMFHDFTEIPVFVVDANANIEEGDLAEYQLRENALRADINVVDKMKAIVTLLDGTRTQAAVGLMANCTQAYVSQSKTIILGTIPEVHEALRTGKINHKDALNIAKFEIDGAIDRAAQLFALEELVNPTKSEEGGTKPRGLADLRKLRVELNDPTAFASAEQTRRDAIRAVLMWVDNPEVSAADLLCPPDGGLNLDANMPEIAAPKEPKPPKEPKAPKVPTKGKKTTSAPVATTAATSASAPPAAARPMISRPQLAKKK